jgi:polysaccharide export outer membrane protein
VPGFQYPTVTQAIELAQGITLTADIRKVQVRRKLASGSEQVINLNLWELIQTGDSRQDLNLRDGDTVFIPTTSTINLDEVRQIATTRFSPPLEEPRSVAVVGEVNRPGTYVVIGGKTTLEQRTLGLPTVTRAIDLAGGIKPLADIRRIQLRRLTKAGTEQIIDLNLWQLLQAGDFSQDTLLQDGDTIFIPTASAVNPAEISELATTSFSPSSIKVSVVGEVKSPGVVQVAPNTTLNQALLTAGGFNDARANRKAVDLIRLNPDGTVSKSKVNIDLTQGINETNNPLVRNNDIIVVSRSGSAKTSDSVRTFLEPIEKVFTFFNIFNLFGILGDDD